MSIFLSYARKDEEVVRVLVQGLEAVRQEVWVDHDLADGDAWWDKILDNIQSATVFVFALSDASGESKPCIAELEYAKALRRPVVPVKVGPVTSVAATPLADLHTIAFRPDDALSGFEVMRAIDEAAHKVPPLPDPLPARPTIPFAYLHQLARQIESTELNSAEQIMAVDELHRALVEETDESVRQDILAMLRALMAQPSTTKRTEMEIDAILGTANATFHEEPLLETPAAEPAAHSVPRVDQNVQFTVYRPPFIRPGIWYSMLAFAHLAERRPGAPPDEPDPLDRVRELAVQTLGDQASEYEGPRAESRGAVPKESELTFVPYAQDIDFNPPRLTFEWQEDVHQQSFRLRAKSGAPSRVVGRMTVYLGVLILADVDLVFRVNPAAAPPNPRPVAATLLKTTEVPVSTARLPSDSFISRSPYRNIFLSYSHDDTEIVEQAERLGAALGDTYLRDRTTLHSGENWYEGLLKLIDKADIFQLFWSSNSMRSEYVRREWEHAVTLARPNFIRPTYWEQPMPRSDNPLLPPSSLCRLHFHSLVAPPAPEREAEGQAQREAEDQVWRDAEEWWHAEEQARREAEQRAPREAEQRAPRETEEQARREAEQRAPQAEQRAPREAEQRAQRETEQRAQREAEQRARWQAEEQARQWAEEQARREAKVQTRWPAAPVERAPARAAGVRRTAVLVGLLVLVSILILLVWWIQR
jgi:hypothetical protein